MQEYNMDEETKKALKMARDSVAKALEEARRRRNDEDRKYILANISKDLVAILTPLLNKIADNSRITQEEIVEIIKNIKVEAPKVDVQVAAPEVNVETPKAEVKVEVKDPKIPPIRVNVPTPKVFVKPADVKLPKEMVVKDMGKLLKAIENALKVKAKVEIERGKPLNVILTDEKGREYKALTSMLTGGGGGIVTTRKVDDIPLGFEQLAVGAAAVGLASIPAKANRAVMTVEDSTLRYRDDGNDPDATTGLRVFIGGTIILNSRQTLTNFRAIRTAAPNSELNINYYERK